MGCDIHGYVEADVWHRNEEDSWWTTVGDLFPFVSRSYDSFGCLFGVRNYANFEPLAPNRGIPSDASDEVQDEYESWGRDAHSASHFYHTDVVETDWSEEAVEPDYRYSILDEDKEPTGSKFSIGPASGWGEVVEENREAIDAGEPVAHPDGDKYIQRRILTREEALSGAWEWLLFDYMPLLAERFDDDSVRLVVWFDN